MRVSIDLDVRHARRAFRFSVALAVLAGVLTPAYLVASQISGLVSFSAGQPIRAADFNQNFQLIETAVNDTDSRLTTLTGQVTPLLALPTQVSTLETNVSGLQSTVNGLQGQVSALMSQNANLLARLNTLEAFTISGFPDISLGGGTGSASVTAQELVNASTIDSTGRVLVVGAGVGVGNTLVVVAVRSDGTLDTTFGTSGTANTNGAVGSSGRAIATDSKGRIIVVGQTQTALTASVMEVWRFLPNGTLDASFQGGNVATVGPQGFAAGYGVTIDSSDRIFVTGQSGTPNQLAVWCLTSTGTLDATFNGTGELQDPSGTLAQALVIDSKGNLVVTGIAGTNMGAWRYTAAGLVDATFNGNGNYIDALATSPSSGYGVVIDQTGRIVIGGLENGTVSGTTQGMAAWRLNPSGTLDPTFGTGGLLTSSGAGIYEIVSGVVLDKAGRVLIGGQSKAALATVWRISTDGQLDPSFGGGAGFAVNATTPINSLFSGFSLDPLGRPTVTGTHNVGALDTVTVYRFD